MNQLAVHNEQSVLEQVVIGGDLSRLSPEQRVSYYRQVCSSLGLNPLTKPFDYITLNGKLTLYARKDAADQLRSLNGISIEKPDITFQDEWIIVTVSAHDAHGRTDSDIGAVKKTDMQGNLGNALMKAVTKAKRRVTLSICGLGMLDETEIETIPNARPVVVAETGEIVDAEPPGMLETAQALGGEVVHAEPAPTTTTNGKKLTGKRPFAPVELRANFVKAVSAIEARGMTLTETDFPIVSDAVQSMLGTEEQITYLKYVTGVGSLDELTEAEIIALKRLLKPVEAGGTWLACDEAVKEARAVIDEPAE